MFASDHLCPAEMTVQDSLRGDVSMLAWDHLCPAEMTVRDNLQPDASMFPRNHQHPCRDDCAGTGCGVLPVFLFSSAVSCAVICVGQPAV